MGESTKNIIAFFLLALTNSFNYNIMQSAANNIVEGRALAILVLLADVFPGFILVIVYLLF